MLTERSTRIRQARKLTRRSARDKAGLFLAEGAQAVREAVRTGTGTVVEIFTTTSARDRHPDVIGDAVTAGIDIHLASDDAVHGLSETVTPQGIVAVCRSTTVSLDDVAANRAALTAILVEARDPGNAGTVIRCADAAGADAVVLTRGSVDPQSGKAVRASAGSLFHLPVVTGADLDDVVRGLRGAGVTVLAADGAGDRDLDDAEAEGLLDGPTAWMFGNEAWGMPPTTRSLADHVVRVPIYGQAESLNLATAAAVCLYTSARIHHRRR